ncbi:diiron oxygenase [Mycobacterium sp.]|uniref:AurF N-oxygenase family protein n=1 Tax=Mycobacterium sp. TaxID=1785 RepID=UPI002C12B966|nr:diiron oxygenase [Mycobacterium sp.]HTQ18219.1 diiron oxygenase [Mycobacterium sp.]
MARTRLIRRWRRNMEVRDDAEYVEMLATLSEGSVRRCFNPYTDIEWDSPEFAVTDNDPRWILPNTDPLGRHPWYLAQSQERKIEIGMWRQANVAKVGLHFESVLIRGLMGYAFWMPNGSPEYRYCLHEAVEECNHTMMFQEMINRIGADVPGMPRRLRWASQFVPLVAGAVPVLFFIGVLAGEEPIDHTQKNILREDRAVHPIMDRVMAIHVAEEARHISFAHEYLRKRLPQMSPMKRFWISLYLPITMRKLCRAILIPPSEFWRKFDIPREVKRELFFGSADSRKWLRDMFADVRMLAYDTGLMNPVALLAWRMCKINGKPSRYRSEPQRQHLAASPAA